jgi:phosphatidylglycerophosphate synthase
MQTLLTPNRVTLIRVLFAICAVALFAATPRAYVLPIGIVGISLTFLAVTLDGLDGFLARRFHLASPIGAQLDILGDRILENLFFTFFAVSGEISLWVPLLFFIRGAITDFLRGLAASRTSSARGNESEYRRNWFLESAMGTAIVASRTSRVAYGAAKCACFCALGIEWTLRHSGIAASALVIHFLSVTNSALLAASISFCILRALPVFWEARADIFRALRPVASVAHTPISIARLRAFRNSAGQSAAR